MIQRKWSVLAPVVMLLAGAVPCPQAGAAEPQFSPLNEKKMKTTNSGLKFEDIKVGTGEAAKAGDVVVVHYTGWLTSGKKFDSSHDRKQPFSFPLGAGKVIKGWDEGVAGMKPGGTRKLEIPSKLAYGQRGAGDVIPPDATLIFEVELLKVLGVRVEDLKVGEGAAAKAGDTVTVHYTGTLTNGKQFDSSVGGQPFTFGLGAGEVIKGWDIGVAGMKVGGKRKLTIPPELGYGNRGAGDDIPPGATLIFEVELLKIR